MLLHLTRRSIQGLAAAALCLGAAACVPTGDQAGASLEQSVASADPTASNMMALAPAVASRARPVARLPEAAGRVTSVRAKDYINGLRQDILLDGGAKEGLRNSLTILARTNARPTLDEAVPLFKPTESTIRSEIGPAFPHVAMQVAERESSNRYGPYGLALGRAGGDVRCLYMWQWIDENRLPQDAGVSGPVSIRVRLCRAATTFDAMAALLDQMTIGGAADGAAAVPVETASAFVGTGADQTARKSPHQAARHVRVTRVAGHAAVRSDVSGPGDDIVHYPAPSLADPHVPPPSPAAASTTAALSADLPPEAYLGPKTPAGTHAAVTRPD